MSNALDVCAARSARSEVFVGCTVCAVVAKQHRNKMTPTVTPNYL